MDGTSGNDLFNGLAAAELYNALAGNDTLNGNGGNDTLNGGADNDLISGGSDNDSLDGGSGNDTVRGDTGNDTLFGGDDDDFLEDYQGTNSLNGGAGADYFEYVSYLTGVDTLTGGTGIDTYSLIQPLASGYAADIVTDFATGLGGDIIEIDQLSFSGLPTGANPFTSGFLRLVQVGADTELQGDQNGGGDGYETILLLQNTTAANFTADNFFPGYSPTGVGSVIDGNDGANNITGTVNDDTISGLGGNDTINGNQGNDSIDGGAGNDNVSGSDGSDTIFGGTGADNLNGNAGNDSLSGGDGQDTFNVEAGNDTFRGGDGDDNLGDYQGANVLDGGAGADYFEYVSYTDQVDTLTGGAGSDVFNIFNPFSPTYVADVITDFATGAGGDIIRLSSVGFSGLPAGANPFTTGFLRLVQSGTSTLLQGDQNGGANDYRTILIFENTTVANFTGTNFDPGFSPTGTGLVITGSDLNNGIAGSSDGDTISGLGGNDTIDGNAGDDSIDGGTGNDNLTGDFGNDTILGGAGNDFISGNGGNDIIDGGDAQDNLNGNEGNDSISGGLGDDTFNTEAGNDTFRGGDGDDNLGDYQGTNVLDGGAGADYFEYVSYTDQVDTLTGGSGSDVFNLFNPFSPTYVADVITDFATGAGGDIIRLSSVGFSGLPAGDNPFTTGFLRLVQSGTSTLLQGDQNGGANDYRTILILENTTVASFTSTNFDPGFSPTGTGLVITGSDGANGIAGSSDGDTISGLGGNDTIDGNAGDDSIDGGTGNDNLTGDFGNDTILGGAGNDFISGNGGNDIIDGGDAQDNLNGNEGNDSISGGLGDDTFNTEAGNDTFRGGDGDDNLGDYQGTNVLDGGAGADYFEYVSYTDQVDTLTGGSGSDVFNLFNPFSPTYVADVITDFATGAGGDIIRLSSVGFSGLPAGDNPFTTGFLRLVQSGTSTLLQGDQNGGANDYRTILILENTTVANFTSTNFDPGFSPTGTGLVITGSDDANGIAGSLDGDTITGLGGNDTIDGNAGDDSIDGGTGNDNLTGDTGNDTIAGGTGNDNLNGNVGNDSVSGGLGDDTFNTEAGNDTFRGGDGDDYLGDYQGANVLDGGAGADYFEYVSYTNQVDTLTGGSGSDVFNLYFPFSPGYVADVITDFQGGAGGDIIRLNQLGLSGLGAGVNPFTAGFLRLQQVGANTELQGDQNGGGDNYVTLLVLQNTTATSVLPSNFSPNYSAGPGLNQTGGAGPDALVGTEGNDTLSGADGNDTITGLGGNDQLAGGNNDDSIMGGDGNDNIDGGLGADYVSGDSGNDQLSGSAGNDTLLGGVGNDNLNGNADNDSLVGGEGNDTFNIEAGNDTFLGGDGDDRLGDYQGANSLDGGAGEDYFEYVSYQPGVDTLTGGTGTDTFNLYVPTGGSADIITDFATGAGGDIIGLAQAQLTGLGDQNPFTAGYLQLVQVGADTELRRDADGGGNNFTTVLVLQNTTATAFTAANFSPAYSPTGVGTVITGTPLADNLVGTPDADTITGLDSNDTITGGGGNDSIDAGSGIDNVTGQAGNDSIDGGAGNDQLSGSAGNDTLLGGVGNDNLNGNADNDSLVGGEGNDTFNTEAGNDTFLGGDGDDDLGDYQGANSLDGGAGEDYFEYVSYQPGVDTLTGGTGTDTFNLYVPDGGSADIITDFATGAGGDVIRLTSTGFTGLGDQNPFTAGYLQLVQVGADTELRRDADGGGNNFTTVLVLQNTTATAFTAANFSPAYSPTGVGAVITGTPLADNLVGTPDADTITGLDSNDTITGGGGNDSINAGAGMDNVSGQAGNDSIDGGAGNDNLSGDAGNDTLLGGVGNDNLNGNADNDSLVGGEGNDTFNTEAGNDTFLGGDGDDRLGDFQGANSLDGGAGEDYFEYVSYQPGVDTLTGGTGTDVFNLFSPDGGSADIITDFATGAGGDVIQLTNTGFTGLGDQNPFTAGYLQLVQVGADTELRRDADGGGNNFTTVLVLQNTTATAFTAANFSPGYSPNGVGSVITGTPLPDALVGTVDGDTITGLDSNDTITGNGGADSIDAGAGNDNASGNAGNDTVFGGTGNDTIDGNAGNDSLSGGEGQDRFNTEAGNDTFLGGDGDDYLGDFQGANSLDGGAGEDYFEYVSYQPGLDTLTGGAGVDVFNLFSPVGGGYDADIVTDFVAGSGGDVIRLNSVSFTGLPSGSNPFLTGHLRLFQSGPDTLLQVDTNGGGDAYVTVLQLQNTNASAFTGVNFDPAFDPTGVGITFIGTPNADSFAGSPNADTAEGREQNDTLDGNAGNDTMLGEGGNDFLFGDQGNDSLDGGSGNDQIQGGADNDYIVGGIGDDTLYGQAGNDTVLAGDGDDYVYDFEGANSVDGGAGLDYFEYVSYNNGVDTLTGGTGSDTFNLNAVFGVGNVADIITDFATGAGGDILRLSNLGFSNLPGGANPFSTGHLQLVQVGANVELQADPDGGGDGFETILSLQNTTVGNFVAANFSPGYDPVGNSAPDAVNDAVGASEDGATTILASALLANDTDPDAGDTRTVTSVSSTSAAGASVSLNGSGDVVYDPGTLFNALRAGQTATDSFSYTITDAGGLTDTATVTVTVTGANDAPTAVADAATVTEDGATTILASALLGNDTDPDAGDMRAIQSVPALSSGGAALSLVAGNVVYDPGTLFNALRAGQTATDSFSYTMVDGSGATSSATVSVTVTGANDAPTAVADAVSVAEDATTTDLIAALLGNDTDPDAGDGKTIVSVNTTGTLGTVNFNAGAQTLTYSADDPSFDPLNPGQTATTTFSYTMRDATGATSTATVTVTVNGVDNDTLPNAAPDAVADAATVTEDGSTTILASALLANDTDPDAGDTRTVTSVSSTSAAGASVSLNGSGDVVYNPGTLFNALRAGQTATDSFSYTITDAGGLTDTATVTVTVTGANDAPTAVADAATVTEDGSTTILASALLANDTDPDAGDTRTVTSVSSTSAAGASVSLNGSGDVVYNPGTLFNALRAGQTATDSFSYTITDAGGLTDTATVTVTVTGANDAPTAVADAATVTEDGATTILASALLGNDTDPDAGDMRAIQSVPALSSGGAALSLVAGNVVYDPGTLFNALRAGQTATDSFSYTMVDGSGATSSATVSVTVTGANDAPTAVADAVSVAEDATTTDLIAALLGNDTDPDAGDGKTIVSVNTTGTLGTVNFNAGAQTLTYSADDPSFDPLNPGQTATTTFSYTMRDATGATSTATVTVTVNGVDNDTLPNAAPDAVADAATVTEDGSTTILASALLANDTDPDAGDTRTVTSVSSTSAAGASVSLNGSGDVVYNPGTLFNALRAGQTATDSFSYTITDAGGLTDTATVTVTVTGANDAPTAVADAATVTEDGSTTILASALLANDTDPDAGDTRTVTSVSSTSAAGASVSLNGSGDVVYNPGTLFNALRAGQTATDSFSYTMVDGSGATSSATVSVTVTGANDAPTAVADAVSVAEDATTTDLIVALLGNDTDPDAGDGKTIVSVNTTGTLGTVNFNAGAQTLTYSADDPSFDPLNPGQTATTTFSYTMRDATGATSTATVTVTVNGVENDDDYIYGTPGNDTFAGGEGRDLYRGLAGNDVIRGNGGNDLIEAGDGNDIISGGTGNNFLFGQNGNDSFGNDMAVGVNRFDGGTGQDTVITTAAPGQMVTANLVAGTVVGGTYDGSTLFGIENLRNGSQTTSVDYTGDDNPNVLTGGLAADILKGGEGNDQLNGSSGNDTLDGGAGADILSGGIGNDVFVLRAGETNGDRILDFAGNGSAVGDTLVFEGFGAGAYLTNVGSVFTINYGSGLTESFTMNTAALSVADYAFNGYGNDIISGPISNNLMFDPSNTLLFG